MQFGGLLFQQRKYAESQRYLERAADGLVAVLGPNSREAKAAVYNRDAIRRFL